MRLLVQKEHTLPQPGKKYEILMKTKKVRESGQKIWQREKADPSLWFRQNTNPGEQFLPLDNNQPLVHSALQVEAR